MAVSYENSKIVFQGIKDAGITSISALPMGRNLAVPNRAAQYLR